LRSNAELQGSLHNPVFHTLLHIDSLDQIAGLHVNNTYKHWISSDW